MKKLLLLMLALVLCLAVFAACVGENNEEGTTEAPNEDPVVDSGLESAVEYIHQLYKDIAEKTGGNYTLITKLEIEGVYYTIEWTVSSDKIEVIPTEGKDEVTISVPQNATEDIPYTLTATVKSPDGKTAQKSYDHIVPKFQYSSFADYAAAEKGDAVVVAGIVTGIVSKDTGSQINGLYIQDTNNDGGYYVYGVTTGFEGIEVGMTVEARGTKDNYNGTLEVKEAAITILDETITPVTPVDFTEIIANAGSLSDTALVGKQGMLVTIKGVTVLEVGDNGYYYFQAGEHKTYLRISGSNNPCTKADLDAVKAAHSANFGNIGDVTGVISIYNGNFYLSPVSAEAFNNFSIPERNDQQKVDFELDGLTFVGTLTSNGDVTVALVGTTYDTVQFVWAVDNTELATLGEGKITFKIPDEATTVKITVTATCGEATGTKDFEVKLSKTITSIEDANKIGAEYEKNTYSEDKYILAGVITELQNDVYGNVIISDGKNSILIYGLKLADGTRYDSMTDKPVVGDYIVVVGNLGKYDDPQMKNGVLTSFTKPTSIEGANTLGETFEKDSYTEDKHLITGVITEVQNETYGNVVISDGANSILVYGLYSFNGADRYDALAVKPAVGDTITVLGIVGKFNAPQVKNAWLVSLTVATTDNNGDNDNNGGETGDNTGTDTPGTVVADFTFDFSTIDKANSVQYAENEKHILNDIVTMTVNDGHVNTQLRLYHSANSESYQGHDSTAVFASTKVINGITLNAGNKADTLNVYGSTDGVNWTLIMGVVVKSSYADYSVAIANSSYTYIKLDAVSQQIRVATIGFDFAE